MALALSLAQPTYVELDARSKKQRAGQNKRTVTNASLLCALGFIFSCCAMDRTAAGNDSEHETQRPDSFPPELLPSTEQQQPPQQQQPQPQAQQQVLLPGLDTLREYALQHIATPAAQETLAYLSKERIACYKHSNNLEITAHVFVALSSLMSFLTPAVDIVYFSFVGGSLGVLAVVLHILARHTNKELQERSHSYNTALQRLGIPRGFAIPLANTTVDDMSRLDAPGSNTAASIRFERAEI